MLESLSSSAPLLYTQTHTMTWTQKTITLPPKTKGSYLVTDEIVSQVPEIKNYKVGMANFFMQHTSAALTLNENWDTDVRADMTDALAQIAPESDVYRHSCEGPDDMPAHIRSSLVGVSINVPIKDGYLATGTWQGIWYLEFRKMRHTRKVVVTLQGEERS